jgi:hypothetical protein
MSAKGNTFQTFLKVTPVIDECNSSMKISGLGIASTSSSSRTVSKDDTSLLAGSSKTTTDSALIDPITYGNLTEFLLSTNVPITNHSNLPKLVEFTCKLLNKNAGSVGEHNLKRLNQRLSSFCYVLRKKYKKVSYNKLKLKDLEWCRLPFVFEFADIQETDLSQNIAGSCNLTTFVGNATFSRLELLGVMRDSKFAITDASNQTNILLQHVCGQSSVSLTPDDMHSLKKSLYFFALEIRKRFLEKGVQQNYNKLIKKYTKTMSGFLSGNIEFSQLSGESVNNFFDEISNNEVQNKEKSKKRLGMGTISPSKLINVTTTRLASKGKSARRLGLSKNEKSVKTLHKEKAERV